MVRQQAKVLVECHFHRGEIGERGLHTSEFAVHIKNDLRPIDRLLQLTWALPLLPLVDAAVTLCFFDASR
jgi:hypothetical protein